MITLIASVTVNPKCPANKYIGDGDDLIVRLSADLIQFKKYTMGKPCIMGYTTFKSVGPLPGRKIYVLSRRALVYVGDGDVEFVNYIDFEKLAKLEKEYVICGGSQIYEQAIPYANKLRITWFETTPDTEYIGDKLFPDWNKYGKWKMESSEIVRPMPSKSKVKIDNYRIIEFYRLS